MGILDQLVRWIHGLRPWARAIQTRRLAVRYARSARRIGDRGYAEFKLEQLGAVARDPLRCQAIGGSGTLPPGFGRGLDERIVEYPWVLGRLPTEARDLLDAGSTLNHDWLASIPALRDRRILVVTLAPEGRVEAPHLAFLYSDLRELPLQDASMDAVVCVSTLEHVGMDNTRYTGGSPLYTAGAATANDPESHRQAFDELARVLRPGGHLLLTVPFGRRRDHGWLQVFDGGMIDALRTRFPGTCLMEAYFRSTPDGWVSATRPQCDEASYRDEPSPVPGGHPAISAGAICALHLQRSA